jgi:hypothetical protein
VIALEGNNKEELIQRASLRPNGPLFRHDIAKIVSSDDETLVNRKGSGIEMIKLDYMNKDNMAKLEDVLNSIDPVADQKSATESADQKSATESKEEKSLKDKLEALAEKHGSSAAFPDPSEPEHDVDWTVLPGMSTLLQLPGAVPQLIALLKEYKVEIPKGMLVNDTVHQTLAWRAKAGSKFGQDMSVEVTGIIHGPQTVSFQTTTGHISLAMHPDFKQRNIKMIEDYHRDAKKAEEDLIASIRNATGRYVTALQKDVSCKAELETELAAVQPNIDATTKVIGTKQTELETLKVETSDPKYKLPENKDAKSELREKMRALNKEITAMNKSIKGDARKAKSLEVQIEAAGKRIVQATNRLEWAHKDEKKKIEKLVGMLTNLGSTHTIVPLVARVELTGRVGMVGNMMDIETASAYAKNVKLTKLTAQQSEADMREQYTKAVQEIDDLFKTVESVNAVKVIADEQAKVMAAQVKLIDQLPDHIASKWRKFKALIDEAGAKPTIAKSEKAEEAIQKIINNLAKLWAKHIKLVDAARKAKVAW